MNNDKSALNGLLLKLDAVYNGLENPNRIFELITLLGDISILFHDPDYEVNRDLFDGVSNETRQVVVQCFVGYLLEVISRAADGPSPLDIGLAKACKSELAQGGAAEVPLDILLRAQGQRKGQS